jgi:hypothetical protein
MGCNFSRESIESKRIEQEMNKSAMNQASKISVLVLGTGDSGKTSWFCLSLSNSEQWTNGTLPFKQLCGNKL